MGGNLTPFVKQVKIPRALLRGASITSD